MRMRSDDGLRAPRHATDGLRRGAVWRSQSLGSGRDDCETIGRRTAPPTARSLRTSTCRRAVRRRAIERRHRRNEPPRSRHRRAALVRRARPRAPQTPHRCRDETGLAAAMRCPQAAVDGEQDLPRLDLVGRPSRRGSGGPPRSRRSLLTSTARCTRRIAAHPCVSRRRQGATGDGPFGSTTPRSGFEGPPRAGWQADTP